MLVLDIGGGSTEFVVGSGDVVAFHVSTHAGSVRQTERNLHSDPPTDEELARCADEIQAEIERAVPAEVRRSVADGVAVAGTSTSFAAIDQALEPYDRERVDGYRLTRAGCERILERLAALPLEARAEVAGLHPQRAPTIVAGGVILVRRCGPSGWNRSRFPSTTSSTGQPWRPLPARKSLQGMGQRATRTRTLGENIAPGRPKLHFPVFPYVDNARRYRSPCSDPHIGSGVIAGRTGASRRSNRVGALSGTYPCPSKGAS